MFNNMTRWRYSVIHSVSLYVCIYVYIDYIYVYVYVCIYVHVYNVCIYIYISYYICNGLTKILVLNKIVNNINSTNFVCKRQLVIISYPEYLLYMALLDFNNVLEYLICFDSYAVLHYFATLGPQRKAGTFRKRKKLWTWRIICQTFDIRS